MSVALASTTVGLPASPFPPLAVGFFGLGTGYLIYGTQELFGYPPRGERVDPAVGIWGIWMPGFMQFIAGIYLFAGLTLFGTFTSAPPLYMAALAFTSYGVHWFAIGWIRLRGADARANVGMTVAFTIISVLGIFVFFKAHDNPVAGLFIGLTGVYVTDFFASLGPDAPRLSGPGVKALGFFHLGTGLWLMYLMWAVALNFVLKYTLPL
jgi:hypothetical protein